MNEERAREILGELIDENSGIDSRDMPDAWDGYAYWRSGDTIVLDGEFTAEKLEAIAWWMKNKGKKR